MSDQIRTPAEQHALDYGYGRLHNGRVIPIMRGGDETEEERAEREAAEATARDKTFTQADLDRIVQERLARDRKDRPSDDELKDLRDAKKRLDDIEELNKSDLDKANARADQAEKDRETALATAKETRLRSAIIAEAAKPDRKVVDVNDVFSLLDKSTLNLDGDGNPTNVAEAMDALLTAKPHLVGTQHVTNVDQGARGTKGVQQISSTDGMTADEIATATAEGRFDTYLKTPK